MSRALAHNQSMATESKRDKKRREIIEKVEKQHAEKIQNFQHIDTQYEYKLASARKLYQVERQKIEDEYKKSRELVRQRLLDGLEERRRKIREDKETTNDIVADTLNDVSGRSRHSRQGVLPKPYYEGVVQGNGSGGELSPIVAAAAARTEAIVKEADSLLQSFTSQGLSTALSIDNIISPLPYSLAVLPPPTQPDRVGKNARRGRNVQQQQHHRDYDSVTPGLGVGSGGGGRDGGDGGGSGDGNGGPSGAGGGVNGTNNHGGGSGSGGTSGPNNTVIRISPAMSGYAKVQGWAPGKSLEDLKTLALASEFEREGDLANMSGWGRRGRQAGKAAAAAIAGKG
ncbi:hypothetical protein QFC19_004440 [Naganishia cerealis]|uniref:Uncharacterized protein n=1 Tax=Naganishia cerealis TaxID=610337 RepID=A0ACC2VVI6_9TREE|nr:hypothetical protein QFC19_004440 [Naganishia cerealis]